MEKEEDNEGKHDNREQDEFNFHSSNRLSKGNNRR